MPSDKQLLAYAETLPDIYREILSAFPRIEPNRKANYGLAYQTLAADLEDRGFGFSLGEIIQACQQLQERGIVTTKHGIFVHPTDFGDRLIHLLTGQEPAQVVVPALPSPPL
jgi:hypothetical protein